ncbi:MAG: nucleoside deaminase [Verrucomicrobia bacterium]|nr:nucleoside deaminase [Verrucomicrobiota bacterium]
MREALKEAQKAFDLGEVPVGAILVVQNKIISRSHNAVEMLQDATAHAEMRCLQDAAEITGNWRLLGATFYCTLEPCAMCAGAMLLSRIDTLVWGAPDLRHGADGSLYSLLNGQHPIHNISVRRGVLAEECAQLMKDFFIARRASGKII